eukprot:3057567-Amphidinium_carterae.1
MAIRWQHNDLESALLVLSQQYPLVQGLASIAKPKLRTGLNRNNFQFVVIEDALMAGFVHRQRAAVSQPLQQELLWSQGLVEFLHMWRQGLAVLGLTAMPYVPSGLRGGGATHHFLMHQDVPRLRRRGRWQTERTLQHYLHEVVYAQQQKHMPAAALELVSKWASLCSPLLTPPSSLSPP